MNSDELQRDVVPSRYLIRQPKALQYYYHGELRKESEGERAAGRFELFLDLLYVALVANFAEDLASHPSGAQLVKYLLIFAPAWYVYSRCPSPSLPVLGPQVWRINFLRQREALRKILGESDAQSDALIDRHVWSDLREIMNSYYTDDLIQRVLILWIMALLVVYGNNATLVPGDLGAMRTTVGAFMAARFTVMLVLVTSSFASFQHRPQARLMAGLIFVSLLTWIPLYFETISIRAKIAVAVVGIIFEEAAWIFAYGPWIKKKLSLEYSTAVDISHEIDRFAAFFIIVLGEYLYSIIVGNPAAVGLNIGLLKALWTLVIAFSLNWIYSVGDGSMNATHPIRRSAVTAFAFFSMHLPLAASLLVGGHVCAASAGQAELETGERWLLGGGLGVGMFCLWFLGMLFKSKDQACLIMPKMVRIGMRLVVAIVLVLLPITSKEQLNPVQLLSAVMALFAFVVIWETVGGLQKGARVFEKWEGRNMRPEEESGVNGEKSTA